MNITIGLNEGGKVKQAITIQLSQAATSQSQELSQLKSLLAKRLRDEASVPKDKTGIPFTRSATEPAAG